MVGNLAKPNQFTCQPLIDVSIISTHFKHKSRTYAINSYSVYMYLYIHRIVQKKIRFQLLRT